MSRRARPVRVSGHARLRPSQRQGEPGTWYAKWRDAAGQHERRLGVDWTKRGPAPEGFLRRRDAEARLDEILVEARQQAKAIFDGRLVDTVDERGGATFEEVAESWLDWAGGESPWKPSTRRNYRSVLRAKGPLMSAFGSKAPRLLTRSDLRRWWTTLGQELSPRNANAQLTAFRAILRWADGTEEFGPVEDPSKGLRKFRDPVAGMPAFFEPEEVMSIVRAASELHGELGSDPTRRERAFASRHDADLFLLAAFTGMRRAEIVSLRWRDVSFEHAVIHVRESVSAKQASTPKSGHARTIPMVPQVAERLAALAPSDARESAALVFPGMGRDGKLDGDALSRRFAAARERSGVIRTKRRAGQDVPLTFHDLRHTFASLLARDPHISWSEIQHAAGHASFKTTQRYMHHRPRREDAERFGRAFAVDALEPDERNAAADEQEAA